MANYKSKIKEIDVTKTGPQSYRDLQKANEAAYQSAASESMFSNMKVCLMNLLQLRHSFRSQEI